MDTANQIFSFKVIRPILHEGNPLAVGALVDLPRWAGIDLMQSGRVEPRDAAEFRSTIVSPAFTPPPTAGIRRR
jgi:hypothetical protein